MDKKVVIFRQKIIFILLFIVPLALSGQNDTVFIFGPNGKTEPAEKQVLKKEIKYRGRKRVRVRTFKSDEENWQLLFTERIKTEDPLTFLIQVKGEQFSGLVTRRFEVQPDGIYRFTDFQDGRIKRKGHSLTKIPLIFHGVVTEFYPGGEKKSESVYENNELISNRNWTQGGQEYIEDIFYSVDREPRYLRGTYLLHDHVLKTFKESKVDLSQAEGQIVVGFVVMEDGRIDGIRIERGMNQMMNEIALQAFQTLPGEWQPALIDGSDVRFYQLFPINFIYHKFEFDYLEMRGSMLYWDIN
jgi:hypothetical protein